MAATPKSVTCPCGYVLSHDDEEQLIVLAQRHAKDTHGMALTRQQVLAMATPVE